MSLHPGEEQLNFPSEAPAAWDPNRRDLGKDEDWYRDLVQHSQDLLCVHDLEGRFLSVNPIPARLLGYSVEEVLRKPMREFIPARFQAQFDVYLQQMKTTGEFDGLLTVLTRSGEERVWECHNTLRRDGRNGPIVRGIAHDVTERVQTERALREGEKRFELFFENAPAQLAMFDREMRYVHVSRRWRTDYGLGDGDLRGVSHYEIFPEIPERWKEAHRRGLAGEVVNEKGDRFERADGTVQWIRWEVRPWRDCRGGVGGIVIFGEDITERKQAEEALRESERRERTRANELEAVLNTVPVAVCIAHDAECRRMTGNRAAQEHLGVGNGHNISQSASAEERPKFRVLENGSEVPAEQLPMQQTGATGKPQSGRELTLVFENGTRRETIANTVALLDENGKVRGVVGTSIDVTDLKRAECDLRESEMRFRAVYERSPVGIVLVDSQTGCFLQVNPKFCEIVGRREDELLGLAVGSITHPNDLSAGKDNLEKLREEKLDGYEVEKRYLRPDGSERWLKILVVPMWNKGETQRWQMGLVEDVTERRRAEEALRQNEERFRVVLKDSPIAVFTQDRDLRYTWAYNSQLAVPASEKIGKTVEDLFEPEEAARISEIRRGVLASGVGVRDEVRVEQGGVKRYFNTTIEPLFDASGKVIGLTGASIDVSELRNVTDALREAKRRLTEEKLYLEQEIDSELGFGEIVGKSKSLQTVMEMVGKVAKSDATVLLLGETGVGKELVARAVHRLSGRADSSFIKLNCAAIPSGLLESELFGHERGSFTGAVSKKIGRIELADKGTLFLDEIGEISMDLQPKLLRVLQDQEFERLGGVNTLKVNFRLIAATNRDLAEGVRENEFRSDLYYRLHVFPIRVPALRERRDDIPLLVEHFVRKCALRMNKSITSIPKKTMEALSGWAWPGNVRELENFIERSVILTQGSVLVTPLAELQQTAEEPSEVDESLEAAEREHIIRALRESHGQIGGLHGAAMRLGLKRTTLQSKLKQLGINARPRSMEN
jgi:formate hydrogenlyase transcriptional activator